MARVIQPAPSRSITLIASILLISALHFAKSVFVPFVLAVLLTFLLAPLVSMLQRRGVNRVLAVMAVISCALGMVGALAYAGGIQLVEVASSLPNYQSNIHNKIEALRGSKTGPFSKISQSLDAVGKELSGVNDQAVSSGFRNPKDKGPQLPQSTRPVPVEIMKPAADGFQYLRDIAGPILGPMETILVVLVFTIFMLIEREQLRNRLFRLAGQRQLSVMTQALDDAAQRVSKYLSMQFLINSLYGALFAAGLYFIGVPYALLWGVLAGVLRFVPYIGTFAAAAMPITVALAMFDDWTKPLFAFGLFLVLEMGIANGLEPWLYGAHTGLSSVAILLAAIFWTALWGPVGLILSMPLTVCLVVMGRYLPQLEFLSVLLGDEPALSPEAHFYQRMLALDDHEARLVVDTFLKDHSPTELYDMVLIPALRLAERDRNEGALDETRQRFLYETLYELIAELGEKAVEQPQGTPLRILCLAVRDEADEIATAMLAQVLERSGYFVISFPVTANPTELVQHVAEESADVVCLSAVPPFALSPARVLAKRLHARNPALRIVTGLWNESGNEARLKERLGSTDFDSVVTTVAGAIECLNLMVAKMPVNGRDDSKSPGREVGARSDSGGVEATH